MQSSKAWDRTHARAPEGAVRSLQLDHLPPKLGVYRFEVFDLAIRDSCHATCKGPPVGPRSRSMQSTSLRADPFFGAPLKSAALSTGSIELRRGRRCRCDRLAAMTYNNFVESSSHDRVAVAILRLRKSFS